ncbi:polyubiquitin-like [Callorhinchus milii]|uniref:Ubiquitin-like protein n=1 Tax=Callorhinchus milii TaxID=7868 RepID=K4FUX9_CALMI|nr:polyubiquitin-like [Callorhinchus milii]AFK11449.1 ubiquitin-like protein [Callorhinchus milii]|eukprot:gi/632967651/ref/XP_007900095.1/ PREDICTED: polyubiquitin-like [Callorhinchus milii]
MRIQVKFITGSVVDLEVDPSIQVSQLKNMIFLKTQVPDHQQRLVLQNGNRVELSDEQRLCQFNVTSSSTILLIVKDNSPIQVFLKNEKGKISTHMVQPSDSVTSFKERVSRQEGVPPNQQRLLHEGKQLEDGYKLSDYNIQAESTIFLLLRLRGG